MGRGTGNKKSGAISLRKKKSDGLPESITFENTITLKDLFESQPTGAAIGPNWIEPRAFYVHEANQFNPEMSLGYLKTIPEIGEKTARLIIEQMGENCIEQIDNDPESLRKVLEGNMSAAKIDDLVEGWEEIRERRGALVQLDPAVALSLVQKDFDGKFQEYRRWFLGSPNLIAQPSDTCPRMAEAGANLAIDIVRGNKIAVFCDYDVDGTTAGEVFRRSVEPYLQSPDQLEYSWADAETGFGLTNDFVREAAASGCKVLVTLDCGSGQAEQVALAQSLGMKVIVVDHHDVAENPANFHLNPKLQDPPSSENTGAQLAWKLGAAVQIAIDSEPREEHFEETLKLAGIGCLADMGPVSLPENRAFFWAAHDHVPAGVQAVADLLNEKGENEHPEIPGAMIRTQAVLNQPKRTTLVKGETISKLLAAKTKEEAEPIAKELVDFYLNDSQPTKEKMVEEALSQVKPATRTKEGEVIRNLPEGKKIAYAVLEDYADYSGNTGVVANKLSKETETIGLVFAKTKSTDANGKPIYKFSSRNEAWIRHQLGEVLEKDDIKEACKVDYVDQEGNIQTASKVGGHDEVVSGTCGADKIEDVVEAFEKWAASKKQYFYPKPYSGPTRLIERQVSADRLSVIERQSARLAPFSNNYQIIEPRVKGREAKTEPNKAPVISVFGSVAGLKKDPENEKWLQGNLTLENGEKREVRFPADEPTPPSGKAEWILRGVGTPGPYYLRSFYEGKEKLPERIMTERAYVNQNEEFSRHRKEKPDWAIGGGADTQDHHAYEHRRT